jgi:hypothetical protein
MFSLKIKLLTISIILFICQGLSKKIKTSSKSESQLTHSGCFEIIKNGDQDFRLRSTRYSSMTNKNLDLFIKVKITCDTLVEAQYVIEEWRLNGNLVSGTITHSIEGTDCLTATGTGLLGTQYVGVLTSSSSAECQNLKGIVFSIKLSTEYNEPLECSTVQHVAIHDIDRVNKGGIFIGIDLRTLVGRGCQDPQEIVFSITSNFAGGKNWENVRTFVPINNLIFLPAIYNVAPGVYNFEVQSPITCSGVPIPLRTNGSSFQINAGIMTGFYIYP